MLEKLEKGFPDTVVDYKWDAAASKVDLRHDFRLPATIYTLSSAWSQKEKTQQSSIAQEVV